MYIQLAIVTSLLQAAPQTTQCDHTAEVVAAPSAGLITVLKGVISLSLTRAAFGTYYLLLSQSLKFQA